MKALVLSDIHGNLDALDAVLKDAGQYKWKEIWLLGDLCGYGPEPEACYRRLLDYPLLFIPGNHDLYLCGRMKGEFFSDEALKALVLSRSLLKGPLLEVMKHLPLSQIKKGVHLVHGSLKDPSRDYILNSADAARTFDILRRRCLLYGHSHIQEFYTMEHGEITHEHPAEGQTASWNGHRKTLINPGSVGQPRDSDNRAAWGIIDTFKKSFTFHRSTYDVNKVQLKMKEIGFSSFLYRRLKEGR